MRAAQKFLEFHQRQVRRTGVFAEGLIPATAIDVGDATQVLYDSDKLNPTSGEDEGWVSYYHDHSPGVRLYRCDYQAGLVGDERVIPAFVRRARELVWLGRCAGFSYRDHTGREVKARSTEPFPELFCTPNGRALLVIQGKRRLLAMMIGGRLGVEDRGIVH